MNTNHILLLAIAQEAIMEGLFGTYPVTYKLIEQSPPSELRKTSGVFVTIKEGPFSTLRGSIGTTGQGDTPIYKNVYEMAKQAAFHDPRSKPVTAEELRNLTVSVSILSELKQVERAEDIRLGIDGVMYQYRGHHALFLPEVAIEQNWSVKRMQSQLCLKASLPPTFFTTGEGAFYTFTTVNFSERIGA